MSFGDRIKQIRRAVDKNWLDLDEGERRFEDVSSEALTHKLNKGLLGGDSAESAVSLLAKRRAREERLNKDNPRS